MSADGPNETTSDGGATDAGRSEEETAPSTSPSSPMIHPGQDDPGVSTSGAFENPSPAELTQPSIVDALREDTIVVLTTLIEDRDGVLANPIDIDLGRAEQEANNLLNNHATAIVELGVNGLFDLISIQRGEKFDGSRYAEILRTMSSEQIAAEARATATGANDALEVIRRRKNMAEAIKRSSEVVVRGVLGAAIMGVIGRRFPVETA